MLIFCFLLCLFPISYCNLPLVSSSYLKQPEKISLWGTADSSQSPLTVVSNGVTGVQRLVSLRPWNLEASWVRGTNISCHTDVLKFNPFILLFFTCILRLSPDFFSPTVPISLLKLCLHRQQSPSQTWIGLNTSHLNIIPFSLKHLCFRASCLALQQYWGTTGEQSLWVLLQFPHWKSNWDAVRASPNLSAFTCNSDT